MTWAMMSDWLNATEWAVVAWAMGCLLWTVVGKAQSVRVLSSVTVLLGLALVGTYFIDAGEQSGNTAFQAAWQTAAMVLLLALGLRIRGMGEDKDQNPATNQPCEGTVVPFRSTEAQPAQPSDDYPLVDAARVQQCLKQFQVPVSLVSQPEQVHCLRRFTVFMTESADTERLNDLADPVASWLGVDAVEFCPGARPHTSTVDVLSDNDAEGGESATAFLETVTGKLNEQLLLPVGLGRDLSGDPKVIDLAKAPHILVAGSTATGKSNLLHLIAQSVSRFAPACGVALYCFDTSGHEFGDYTKKPETHAVADDSRRVKKALIGLVDVMSQRKKELHRMGYTSWAEWAKTGCDETQKMPAVVVLVDDFVDMLRCKGINAARYCNALLKYGRTLGVHFVGGGLDSELKSVPQHLLDKFPTRIGFYMGAAESSELLVGESGCVELWGRGTALYRCQGQTLRRLVVPVVEKSGERRNTAEPGGSQKLA